MMACWSMTTHHRGNDRRGSVMLYVGVLLPVRWDMQTPQTSPAFSNSWPRWLLPIDQHASMPACHNRNAGMRGCTQAAQTDQHSWPPSSLAGHRPALQDPGGGQECWSVCAAGMHPSMAVGMLACWHAGQWPANEGGTRNAGMSVLLGCTPASQTNQHPCRWHAGMLVGGQPVKNANLSVLLGCTQACRQLGGSMLACRHDGMLVDDHPSSRK